MPRFFGRLPYRKNIVAVHADGIDAVADASTRDAIPPILFQRRGRDCVPIVTADEHSRARPCSGDVKRSVEVPFARSTFTEIADYDTRDDVEILKALHFKGVGSAGGLRNLCGQGGGDGVLLFHKGDFI